MSCGRTARSPSASAASSRSRTRPATGCARSSTPTPRSRSSAGSSSAPRGRSPSSPTPCSRRCRSAVTRRSRSSSSRTLTRAADAVGPLVAAGATATELMVAPTLIAAAYNMPGTPERWQTLPPTSAALLVEFRAEEPDALESLERAALDILEGRAVDRPAVVLPRRRRDRDAVAGARGDARTARRDPPARRPADHRGRVRAAGPGRRGSQGSPGAADQARLSAGIGGARIGRATSTFCSPRTSASPPTSTATTPSCTSSSR